MEISPITNKPYDDFLKVLKPSPGPFANYTKQLIFDKIYAQMIHQGRPCMKMDDATGELSTCNFNRLGHVNPLLALLDRDRLRVLKKTIGYDELQVLEPDYLYFTLRQGDGWWKLRPEKAQDKKATYELIEAYRACGLRDELISFLTFICDRHTFWQDYVTYNKEWKYTDPNDFMFYLRASMKGLVEVHNLSGDSLKTSQP